MWDLIECHNLLTHFSTVRHVLIRCFLFFAFINKAVEMFFWHNNFSIFKIISLRQGTRVALDEGILIYYDFCNGLCQHIFLLAT